MGKNKGVHAIHAGVNYVFYIITDYHFLNNLEKTVNKKHHRVSAQLHKNKFAGPVKHNLLSERVKLFKESLKVYPGLTLLSIFVRYLNDGVAEGFQIFCHRFQEYKEGDMTAVNQTLATVAEGAKDCNKLF